MFYDPGCHGRVDLGPQAPDVQRRLAAVPGEWLEFDAAASAIVVRHVQPTAGPSLPTIAQELVRFIEAIPASQHAAIAGGEFHVHVDGSMQLVRLRVEQGGAVHIRWAHPDYARAAKRPYERGTHQLVDATVQRLDGTLTLKAADPAGAARALQHVADTYEGLYPEGDCSVSARADGTVEVRLQAVNLDVELLVARATEVAIARTLSGAIDVSSFANQAPEHNARFVFDDGRIWIQRPVLWDSDN
jgi:hypothetical protein